MANKNGEILYLGLDIGSVSVNSAVATADGRLLEAGYTRTQGRPLPTALAVLEDLFTRWPREGFAASAVTGAGGGTLAGLLGAHQVNEIIALARGVGALYPQVRAIIDLGGEDAKLVLTRPREGGGLGIEDFAMNTICAAGTGSFLDQQAHRLELSIEQFGQLALKCQTPPRLAGRCSVFAKSDMIHLQQAATPDHDIVAGLCFAVARNLKSNIARGKEVEPPVCFTGGVAYNQGVRRALREVLGLSQEQLIIPEHPACLGALGAALDAADQRLRAPLPSMEELRAGLDTSPSQSKRLTRLKLGEHHQPQSWRQPPPGEARQGYLGVDVGSISTNVVVIDSDGRLLSKQYLMTAGRPLEAVKEGLRLVSQELGEQIEILGAATTGSGRYLTADFIGADLVRNEITAQATAAAAIDPDVDTIFEIGGQDSKYISLKDGAIVDFMMNKVCAAGTGSFLEEQAEKLGINIKEEFGRRALGSPSPVRLGERCTVFMESDLVSHQAAGETTDDLVAGLSYSIVYNYLNKVVENRRVGQRIFFQGGTAANQGIVAAFEAVVGRPITVPDHHDVTGAIGAALLALRERNWPKSKFKGWQVSQANYEISTFECEGCANQCTVRKVKVQGEKRPLFYGSRCEKYEREASGPVEEPAIPDLLEEREEMLLSYLAPVPEARLRGRVGLPRTTYFRDMLPFFATFCQELGFELVLSSPTNKKLIHRGVEAVVNEPCFPIKVAHGHLRDLMDQGVKRIFLPAVVNMAADDHPLGYGQVCPYAQTLPYTAPAALDLAGAGVEMITGPVHFGFGPKMLEKDLRLLAQRLGGRGRDLRRALRAGLEAQANFWGRLEERGRQVLDQLGPDEVAMVVVSRPYNGLDPGINLGLPGKMRRLGAWAIPMDFLPLAGEMHHAEVADMYWRYGQKMLAAARLVRRDPRLYAVFITNFGCGPDSFIGHFFERVMEGKPHLEIEIDEHSGDAGVITRLEAFMDSLRNSPPKPMTVKAPARRNVSTSGRTIYIPAMTDHAHGVAAAFRACGAQAQVLPESDQRTLELGRRYTSGKECYPCALTTGDMVKLLQDQGADPAKVAFFMPSGGGPCRFGQYHRFHRMVLDQLGLQQVPVYSPDQSAAFYRELNMAGGSDFTRLGWQGVVVVDLLMKALHETRPHELRPGDSDRIYQEYLARMAQTIEERGDLAGLMAAARAAFAAVPRGNGAQIPLVGIVGEIYTRANRFANENVVLAVESLGGQAWLPTIGEWVLYVNQMSMREAWTFKDFRGLVDTYIKNHFQHKDERWLSQPWLGGLHTLEEPPIRRVLELARPYLDPSYEGEPVLSVGKSRDMAARGASGIINVLPFTCMPGNIVNAVMKRVREDNHNLPFLPLAMDGQQLSGTRLRLEAFMHQVREHHQRRGEGR